MFSKNILTERETNKPVTRIAKLSDRPTEKNSDLLTLLKSLQVGQIVVSNRFGLYSSSNRYPFSFPLQINLIEWRLIQLVKQLCADEIDALLQINKINTKEYLLLIKISHSLITKILNVCHYINITTNQIINEAHLQLSCKYHVSRNCNSILILGYPPRYDMNSFFLEDIVRNYTQFCYIYGENGIDSSSNFKGLSRFDNTLYNPPEPLGKENTDSMEALMDSKKNESIRVEISDETFKTVEISITKKQVSQIIGHKGQTIEWLRDVTGCIIKIIPIQEFIYKHTDFNTIEDDWNSHSRSNVNDLIQKIRVTGLEFNIKQLISLLENKFKLSELPMQEII